MVMVEHSLTDHKSISRGSDLWNKRVLLMKQNGVIDVEHQ